MFAFKIGVCSPNPCLNGGLCKIDEDGNYKCECAEGWEGEKCTIGRYFLCWLSNNDQSK